MKNKLITFVIIIIAIIFMYDSKETPSREPFFNFPPLRLVQEVVKGDLPYDFFLSHNSKKENQSKKNPGIVTYKDFIIWVGKKYAKTIDDKYTDSYEQKGFEFVKKEAEKENRNYQTILAGYYLYFKHNPRNGLYWAHKAAEAGETGSMVMLGDAYNESYGVIVNSIEGTKWYLIASTLGNLAAQGRLLALFGDPKFNQQEHMKAIRLAQKWMKKHKEYFISSD